MKTSIDHLPADKIDELHNIVQLIMQRLPAEMIILFGSFARGDWVDDRYQENGTTYEYKSDFDIMVVLNTELMAVGYENSKRWQNKLRRNIGSTPVNIIFHGINYLNTEITDGNYFFVDILKEGIMLFNSGNFQLSTPEPLNPQQRQLKAQLYFDKWFESANRFYFCYETCLEQEWYSEAAFELHQAAERYYMCVILVYTDYKPKLHDLEKLDKQVSKLDNRFKTIFPRSTPEDERLFTLLKKAYIDSRYRLDYSICKSELLSLSQRVVTLGHLTAQACKQRIDSYIL